MQPTIKLDTIAVDRAFAALVKFSPLPLRGTLRAEAGAILKTCAGRTKVAKPAAITNRARLQAIKELGLGHRRASTAGLGSEIGVNAGIRGPYGQIWRRTKKRDGTWGLQRTHGPNFVPLHRHFSKAVWTDLKEAVSDVRYAVDKKIPLAKKSAGLARQSWIQIADDIGIRLEDVPGGGISAAGLAKARAAIASDGVVYKNGQGAEFGAAQEFTIRLINNLPYARRARLDSVLAGAINGRVKFFQRNLSLGVFESLDKTLKAYPGWKVSLS